MARKKYKPKSFETTADAPFISSNIFLGMLTADAFKDLSSGSVRLYLYMKLQFYGQKQIPEQDELCFYFNLAMIKSYGLYTNMAQFRKDRNSLIEHGFIELVMNGANTQSKSIYRFSDKWQTWKP